MSKVGSCPFVCHRFVRFSVHHVFLHIHSSVNWSPNLIKLSAYVQFDLLSWFITFGVMYVPVAQPVKTCTLLLYIFCYFFCKFFLEVLKPILTENENMEATLTNYIDKSQFFCFFIFTNSVRKSYEMAKMCPKIVKNSFFNPGGQNMTLRNKSHEIKKFCHVLQCHLSQYGNSKIDGFPPLIFQTMQNLGVVKKMKVAQEGILSWFIVSGECMTLLCFVCGCVHVQVLFGPQPKPSQGLGFFAA